MRAINKSTALGRIVKTDASCVINGRSYPGIPTLVWPEGVDERASGWFRDLMTTNGVPASSAYEYAKILRPFLRFCRMRARSWDSVDDDFLIMWREKMRRVDKADIPRINTSLRTIFAFYRWAEQTHHLRYHVGIYDPADLPAHFSGNGISNFGQEDFLEVATWQGAQRMDDRPDAQCAAIEPRSKAYADGGGDEAASREGA